MYGAIYGDLIGSLYEYKEFIKHNKELMIEASKKDELLTDDCFYSDDTILTIAITEAVKKDLDFEETMRRYILANDNPVGRSDYFEYMFSPSTLAWAYGEKEGNSKGNGALMRLSAIPMIGRSYVKVIYDTMLATTPSHNSHVAVEAATCLTNLIFLAKSGASKKDLESMVKKYFNYSYDFDIDTLRTNMRFNVTCNDTLPLVLFVIFNTNSFDEAMRLMLSIGGDTDTNCCILGSVLEAMYGMSSEEKLHVESFLPSEYVKILRYPVK